jgi:diaminopimelate decarboxylase
VSTRTRERRAVPAADGEGRPGAARGLPGAPTFTYRDGLLHCEDVALEELYGHVGPAYVYSVRRLRENAERLRRAFARSQALVAYAVKANSNPAIIRLFRDAGLGAEVGSGAELELARSCGVPAERIVVGGNVRSEEELERIIAARPALVSVDSEAEALRLEAFAAAAADAGALPAPIRVAARVNPDIPVDVHPDLATGMAESKFGMPPERVLALCAHREHTPHLAWVGLHVHVGSQILDTDPLLETLSASVELVERLQGAGVPIEMLNLGGGFGIDYEGHGALALERFADAANLVAGNLRVRLVVEPGRYLVADSCALLGRVLAVKKMARTFVVTDLGMNDLIRPALYDAVHAIAPVREPAPQAAGGDAGEVVDVVGPVCESGDHMARGRRLPKLRPDDLLVVTGAGAYGYSMASNYNGRGRLPEVLVDGDQARIIRYGESWRDIVRLATDVQLPLSGSGDAGAPPVPRPAFSPTFGRREVASAVSQGLLKRRRKRPKSEPAAPTAAGSKSGQGRDRPRSRKRK